MPSSKEIETAAAAIRDFLFQYRNDVVSPIIHSKQLATAALTAAEAVRTRQQQVFRNDRDIVERLRELSDPEIDAGIPITLEAANEIERLRKVIAAEPTISNKGRAG